MSKIRVAVVDDSSFVRKALTRMLNEDPRLEVVGTADSGEELLAELENWRPDVITLDLSMPGIGGLPTLDHIMVSRPTPVIILSTHAAKDAPLTIEALHRGAVDFIDKQSYSLMDFQVFRRVLLDKILHVTRPTPKATSRPPALEVATSAAPSPLPSSYDILLIGASTGGPPVIEDILSELGGDIRVPVAIAQHMPSGFTRAFAERLNSLLPISVREPEDQERLVPSCAYIAPGGRHLRIRRDAGGDLFADVSESPEGLTHRPSVDVLFSSVTKLQGLRPLAILLTGMGRDGADGMARILHHGGYTIAQDRTSCVVYGMPQAAVTLRAVCEELPAPGIAGRVRDLLNGDLTSKRGGPLRSER